MKKKLIAPLLILASGAAIMASALPASAQVSAQYHAEEEAFRARQDEGSRLYTTFGPSSPQYVQWQLRETAIKNGGSSYNSALYGQYGQYGQYGNPYGQSQYYGNPFRSYQYSRYGYMY